MYGWYNRKPFTSPSPPYFAIRSAWVPPHTSLNLCDYSGECSSLDGYGFEGYGGGHWFNDIPVGLGYNIFITTF